MPETPNHEYNVPAEGANDWHVPLNENFEQHDTDIEIRGEEATVQDYEPKAGAKFFATDSGRVYVGDGERWSDLESSGPSPILEELRIENSVGRLNFDDQDGDLRAVVGYQAAPERFLTGLFESSGDQYTALSALADGSRHVGIGHLSPETPLDLRGQNNWNVDSGDGDLRIGNADYRLAMGVALGGGGAGACNIRAKGGIERLNLGAGTSGATLRVEPDAATVQGDLDVTGNKNFVETVDTADGEREVAPGSPARRSRWSSS